MATKQSEMDPTMDQASANQTYNTDGSVPQATHAINAFMPWLLIVVGIVFNGLIILGMRTKNFCHLSTSVYMAVGAINDITSIPILLFAHWLHLNFPETIVRENGADVLCKFFNFYGWGQADLGMILISAMTADRAYVILRPMTTVDLVKRAKIVTGICLAIVAVKDFHFWFFSVIVSLDRKDRLCDVANTSASYNEFYRDYWPWLDTVFVTLCFVVMVISNCVLIRHVRKNRQGRELKTREDTPGSARSQLSRYSSTMSIHAGTSYSSVSNQVTKMLLGESLALFFLSYPFSIHLMVTSRIHDLQDDPDKARANALAFNVVFYLLYANKCVTFLVYCCAGRKFRKAVADEVLCRFKCGKYQFGGGRRASESGDGSFQSPCQQQQQRSENSKDRLTPIWKNMRTLSCVRCTSTKS